MIRTATTTRALALVASACLTAGFSGCSSLPDSGPVHEVNGATPSSSTTAGPYYDPARPADGASQDEILDGFIEAMKAIPVRSSVAREYLTRSARATWNPEGEIITYDSLTTALDGDHAVITLSGAGSYDGTGAWQGQLTEAERTLRATLSQEDGQWRVDHAPDALLVPSSWFAEQYQRAARYLFDPTGRVLTPEPIFVARGDQLSTLLVNGLTAEVPDALADVVRTDLPTGVRAGLSVPVDTAGVAQVDLSGTALGIGVEQRNRMSAQFIWTLRQDPRVRAVSLTLSGQPLGNGEDLALNGGAEFDPTGASPDRSLFGIRDGALVRGTLSDLEAVSEASELLSSAADIAVTVGGEQIAVVDGERVSVSVGATGEDRLDVAAEGTDLLDPAWDLAGRLWLVDGGARARLRVRDVKGALTEVQAPGITGQRVRQFLVSRDGTRVVALIRGRLRDRVVVARVRQTTGGVVRDLTSAQPLWFDNVPPQRFVAIGWQGASAVAALSRYTLDTSQVQVAGVDGAPVAVSDPVLLRGNPRSVLGTPSDATRVLVRTDAGLMDSSTQTMVARTDKEVRGLGFTG